VRRRIRRRERDAHSAYSRRRGASPAAGHRDGHPGCDGVAATARITAEHPGTRVVVLTTYADDESIIGALQAGALGYPTKDATRGGIGRALRGAAARRAGLGPQCPPLP